MTEASGNVAATRATKFCRALIEARSILIACSICVVSGCGVFGGAAMVENNMKSRQLWRDSGYSVEIYRLPIEVLNYSADEFASELATVAYEESVFLEVLRSGAVGIFYVEDDEQIYGWLEVRLENGGWVSIYWTGIEARKPAISTELAVSEARRIFLRSARDISEAAEMVHARLTQVN